jgi:CRP-like cAMP-binding protein
VEQLITFFRNSGFAEAEAKTIAGAFSRKSFTKGDYLLEAGQTSRHLGFVANGHFMFFVLADGEERTTYVVGENQFVASLWSFLKETPAREYIRCIGDGDVWMISKTDLQRLQKEVPSFQEFYIQVLENEICCIEDSRYNLITLNAEQRYLKLMQDEPHLLQHIPLQYLASILGVTPRHLSRIRAKIV